MTDADDRDLDVPFGRVVWRCRRGLKELDVLLERFARERYPSLPPDQQRAFLRLLDLPDPQVADYLLGNVTPEDPSLAGIVRLIASHLSGSASVP